GWTPSAGSSRAWTRSAPPPAHQPSRKRGSAVISLSPRVTTEIKWRAAWVLDTLHYSRAVASLESAELTEIEALIGAPLADAAETGRSLLDVSDADLAGVAAHLDHSWDHPAMRKAAATVRRDGCRRWRCERPCSAGSIAS